MNPNSKEFKKLQKEWDAKLKNSGFDDAEQRDGRLKVWHNHYFTNRHSPDQFITQEIYYRIATDLLTEYKFANDKEKLIWRLHAEGLPYREIYKKMTRYYGHPARHTVYKVINTLRAEIGRKLRDEQE